MNVAQQIAALPQLHTTHAFPAGSDTRDDEELEALANQRGVFGAKARKAFIADRKIADRAVQWGRKAKHATFARAAAFAWLHGDQELFAHYADLCKRHAHRSKLVAMAAINHWYAFLSVDAHGYDERWECLTWSDVERSQRRAVAA